MTSSRAQRYSFRPLRKRSVDDMDAGDTDAENPRNPGGPLISREVPTLTQHHISAALRAAWPYPFARSNGPHSP